MSSNEFGTNEALSFARKVGGELMISVDIVTGTPQEAAEWVRYVNGGGKHRVTYWEIGNEQYVPGGSPRAEAASMSSDEYAQTFLRYAGAMREADPTIRLGAISDINYGLAAPENQEWTERVLSTAGSQVDFLSVHNAYAPMLVEYHGQSVREVYAAMLAAPILVDRSLDEVVSTVRRVLPDRAADLEIAVTEWGPFFQIEADGVFVDHGKTLGSALYVADVLRVFVESPEVEMANYFTFAGFLYMGWISPRSGEYAYKPSSLAFQLYTQHFGDRVVESVTEAPTYASRSIGWVSAVPEVPYLEVVASRGADGQALYLMAINKHFDRGIRATVAISGFIPNGTGTSWTLNGTGIDANTGTELFQAPGVRWAKQAGDEPNPRIDRGGPDEVTVTSAPLSGLRSTFEYTFPPHSVTALELHGR
jgi:alpha-N-arabinofuranosidase